MIYKTGTESECLSVGTGDIVGVLMKFELMCVTVQMTLFKISNQPDLEQKLRGPRRQEMVDYWRLDIVNFNLLSAG